MVEVRPKKQASERRKQQNRVAQKGYRERQKRRIQELERLVKVHDHDLDDLPSTESSSTVVSSENGFAGQGTLHRSSNSTLPVILADVPTATGDPEAIMGAGVLGPVAHPSSVPLVHAQRTRTPNLLRRRVLDKLMREIDSLDETVYNQILSGDISVSQIFQAGLQHVLSRPSHDPLNTDTSSSGRQDITLRTDKILVLENRMQLHTHALPDVYANHLRLKQFTTVAALRASAESTGLTFDLLINPDTESPFYRSISRDTAETMSKEEIQNVPPHLRPSIAQIRHPHHAYLDAFPFPTFRRRIIEACSLESPLLDMKDLCDDLENGAFICWGSYLGDGNNATGFGAPWDYRSWEDQPWFPKKWWFFIGGAEGELFQQTRWWHEMRGDRLVAPW